MTQTVDEIKAKVHKIKGWFNDAQMEILHPIVSQLPPRSLIVEIGTYKGRSTLFFALANPDALVLTVDKGEDFPVTKSKVQVSGSLVDSKVLRSGQIFQIVGDSYTVAALFNWPIALLFIDGDHSYLGVKDDIGAWVEHIVHGGYVVFHDYGKAEWPGVGSAVNEWLTDAVRFDIVAAEAWLLVARRME